jgi:hypothetical protein
VADTTAAEAREAVLVVVDRMLAGFDSRVRPYPELQAALDEYGVAMTLQALAAARPARRLPALRLPRRKGRHG